MCQIRPVLNFNYLSNCDAYIFRTNSKVVKEHIISVSMTPETESSFESKTPETESIFVSMAPETDSICALPMAVEALETDSIFASRSPETESICVSMSAETERICVSMATETESICVSITPATESISLDKDSMPSSMTPATESISVLAVDSDPVPLKLLGANAPQTTTVVATLGEDEVDLPPPAPDLHIHLSTPCTELSIARNKGRTPESINNGLDMIRWAVELVLERGDSSWSLENVATKATRALLSELQAAHPERVAFALFDSADFGAPQSRVRLIAGPKKLIRMLQGIPSARRVSVRDAFAEHTLAPSALFVKNQTRGCDGTPTVRTVETQSFTVCASHGLTWCDADGKSVKVMTARDSAILMGFPLSWQLPKGSRVSQQAVGNAI